MHNQNHRLLDNIYIDKFNSGIITIDELSGCATIQTQNNAPWLEPYIKMSALAKDITCHYRFAIASSKQDYTIPKSLVIRFCNLVANDKETQEFNAILNEYISKIDQHSLKNDIDAHQVLQYFNNYIHQHNLFEMLKIAKKIPFEHEASMFNQNLSHKILGYLNTSDIIFDDNNETVTITGDSENI